VIPTLHLPPQPEYERRNSLGGLIGVLSAGKLVGEVRNPDHGTGDAARRRDLLRHLPSLSLDFLESQR